MASHQVDKLLKTKGARVNRILEHLEARIDVVSSGVFDKLDEGEPCSYRALCQAIDKVTGVWLEEPKLRPGRI